MKEISMDSLPLNNQKMDLPTLQEVIDYSPLIVTPDISVADVITLLSQPPGSSNHGCVLIVKKSQLVGIFTLTDAFKLSMNKINLSEMPIAEVMTSQIITLKQSQLQDTFTVLSFLRQHQIQHLPILGEGEELLGIVTETSLMANTIAALQQQLEARTTQLRDARLIAYTIQEKRQLEQLCDVVQPSVLQQAPRDRQHTDEELLYSEEWLRLALDTSKMGLWDWNILTDSFIISESASRLFGLVPGTFGRTYEAFLNSVHPEDRELVAQAVTFSLDAAVEHSIEFRTIWQDGSIHWIAGQGKGYYNSNDVAVRMIGTVMDITQHRQAFAALQESEERFRTMADTAPVMIWLAGTDKLCNYFNKGWLDFTGCSLEEEIGNGWTQNIHPEDYQRCVDNYFTAFDARQSFLIEYRLRRFDGVYRWILDRGTPRFNADRSFVGYIGSCIDISDRKHTEDDLKEMSEALSNAVEGISRVDTQGRYVAVNRAYASAIGYTPEEMIGMEWSPTVHPEDREKMIAAYQYMCLHGKVEVEARGVRKDGSIFYKQLVMLSAFDEQGRFTGHHCFMKDISDRIEAEQKISEQAALLDVATDAILVRGLDQKILYWNQGAERLYGWTIEEALNQNANKLLYKELYPQLETALFTVVESGSWQGELHKVNKTGKEIIVASRWTLIRDEAGQAKSILTVDTDITEKKQLETQFLRTQRMDSLGTLASGIAHDLNNILTPILAVAQLLPLTIPNLNEQNVSMLDMLETNVKRGADLVKQILSFARGTEGKRIPVQVKHLLLDIEQIVKGTFPKTIEVNKDIQPNLMTVAADATQLHQVLMNLCVNARDAMPNGGTLTISAANLFIDAQYTRMNIEAKVGSYIVINIADSGIGIPEEIIDRIFEPFFTTKEVGKGTGLGLSTVIGIIKSHGGFVEVLSQCGKGSQFKVYLPSSLDQQIQSTEDLEVLIGNGELILVVDDEIAIAEITKATLETHNYRTLIANDGIEAISIYAQRKHEIALVIMDMMMPSLDGLTAIRTLQKINPNVVVVTMSGLTSSGPTIAEIAGINIQGVLSKPFTTKELLNSLHGILTQE
jgi:PAS domain S-box-containing protein